MLPANTPKVSSGTVSEIVDPDKTPEGKLVKPAARDVAFQVILYVFGVPTEPLKDTDVLVSG